MLKIYNSSYLNNKDRLIRAIIIGLVVAILAGYIIGLISALLGYANSVFCILCAYVVSMAIQKGSRCIDNKVIIIGGICCVISMIVYDYVTLFNGSLNYLLNLGLFEVLKLIFTSRWLNFSINGLMGLIFRCLGIYYGAYNSRVL